MRIGNNAGVKETRGQRLKRWFDEYVARESLAYLRETGEKLGLNKVAEQMGVNGSTLSRLHNDKGKRPGHDVMSKILKFYRKTEEDLKGTVDPADLPEVDPAEINSRRVRLAYLAGTKGIARSAVDQVLWESFQGGSMLSDEQLIENMRDAEQAAKGKAVGVTTIGEEADESPAVKRSRKSRLHP